MVTSDSVVKMKEDRSVVVLVEIARISSLLSFSFLYGVIRICRRRVMRRIKLHTKILMLAEKGIMNRIDSFLRVFTNSQ